MTIVTLVLLPSNLSRTEFLGLLTKITSLFLRVKYDQIAKVRRTRIIGGSVFGTHIDRCHP